MGEPEHIGSIISRVMQGLERKSHALQTKRGLSWVVSGEAGEIQRKTEELRAEIAREYGESYAQGVRILAVDSINQPRDKSLMA